MSDYFDRVERQIVRSVEARAPRRARVPVALGHLASAAAVLVVIAVVAVFLLARGAGPSGSAAGVAGVRIVFSISPQSEFGPPIGRSIHILRERLEAVIPGVSVTRAGNNIVVQVPGASDATRNRILALAAPGRLQFYDWEASVVTPNGKTVAGQLGAQNPAGLEISQGSGSLAPGDPGAGSMSLPRALGVAKKLPSFIAVVQAITDGAGRPTRLRDQSPQFYVLRGAPVLTGTEITDPHETTLPTGGPGISFAFNKQGKTEFQTLTAAIARRGSDVSGLGLTLNQHFAVTLDDKLIDVPFVDYKQYPDGISAAEGVDLAGSFTVQSAKDVATLLRFGPLPVRLTATG